MPVLLHFSARFKFIVTLDNRTEPFNARKTLRYECIISRRKRKRQFYNFNAICKILLSYSFFFICSKIIYWRLVLNILIRIRKWILFEWRTSFTLQDKSFALRARFERWDESSTRFWVGWYTRTMRRIGWKRLQKDTFKNLSIMHGRRSHAHCEMKKKII